MQKILLQQSILLLLIFFTGKMNGQDTTNQYNGGFIAGTQKKFIIEMRNEPPIKAKILSIQNNGILIKESNGNTRSIDRSKIVSIKEIPFGSIGSFGVGFGVPYGVLGINLDINPLPYMAISGGIGTTFFAGLGYNIGIRGYFRKPGPIWRPRVSLFYGINGIYAEDFNDPDNEKYPGITAGLGQLFLWDRHGFDFDIMYIVKSEIYDNHDEEPGRIKISIGYRYAF